jgi:hypothetical protein
MLHQTQGYKIIQQWLHSKGYQPFEFQEQIALFPV